MPTSILALIFGSLLGNGSSRGSEDVDTDAGQAVPSSNGTAATPSDPRDEGELKLVSIRDLVPPDGFAPACDAASEDNGMPEFPQVSKPSLVEGFDAVTGLPVIAFEMRSCASPIEDADPLEDDLAA